MTMRVSLLDDKNHMSSALTDMYSIFRKRFELNFANILTNKEPHDIPVFNINSRFKPPTHSPQDIIVSITSNQNHT